MQEELNAKIASSAAPADVRQALERLVEAALPVMQTLRAPARHQARFALYRLVEEATDAAPEVHWWEVALDLLAKALQDQGDRGGPALQAARQVAPLLQERLADRDGVTLQEITAQTVWGVCLLSDTLTEPKANYVAPNAISLAQAHFNPHAWFRAVYAGKAPVGFMMIVDDAAEQKYFLWRFMIAEPYHGRGYGRQAVQRLVEYVKTRPGATELLVSCGQGEGSPEGFYRKLGFEPTGDVLGHEIVLRLPL